MLGNLGGDELRRHARGGGESPSAREAEGGPGGKLGATSGAGRRDAGATLHAEARLGGILLLASRTPHEWGEGSPVPGRWSRQGGPVSAPAGNRPASQGRRCPWRVMSVLWGW